MRSKSPRILPCPVADFYFQLRSGVVGSARNLIIDRTIRLCFAAAMCLCLFSGVGHAQAWSGILNPTYGSGACNPTSLSAPQACAIDWSTAGIPGGIPSSWTQSGATINATNSACNNGSGDCTSTIQAALNACGTNQFVQLGAGTFLINGNLSIPSNCYLTGLGANQTILNSMATSGAPVSLGSTWPNFSNATPITGGASAGSTSFVVGSASGISVGGYLVVSQLNDGTVVTNVGSGGTCGWSCDGGEDNGGRAQGQIVEVTNLSGTTITFSPALFVTYSNTPHATFFSATKYAGVENLQIYANNTHSGGDYSNILMQGCAYCWVSGVEGNYTDGDHVEVYWNYHGEVVNSYFSNSFLHTPGTYDSDLVLADKTTGMLVENNILERLHTSLMLEWGAAGNVVAHNYAFGTFDAGSPNAIFGDIDLHGANPQFNLFEGNVANGYGADSTWGSATNNTFFRNWPQGTTQACMPLSGRGPVICTPFGVQGNSGINGWQQFQASRDVNVTFLHTNVNLVGNVVGSSAQSALTAYGNPFELVNLAVAVCGPSPCGSGSRGYGPPAYAYSIGYGEAGDNGSSGFDSLVPYTTLFIHGDYSNATGSVNWQTGITHTLPASFYLSGKPSWWGSVPYPAIGPDVSGGSGPGGHANLIPAQVCYTHVMGGTNGAGSPLSFNAANCYGSGTTSQAPQPPTGLSASVQ